MTSQHFYPIGKLGTPWNEEDKKQWLDNQQVKRSYQTEVLDSLLPLTSKFDLVQYGALPYDEQRYPLYAAKTRDWDDSKPTVLITGGVHGYETSGVQGALRFLATQAQDYAGKYNIIVAPCISPWGYETINRWNPAAVDPNRSFKPNSVAPEVRAIMDFIESLNTPIFAHFDLHETTDTDNTEFRLALAARDGNTFDEWEIPDGFYSVGDAGNPTPEFQKAIIDSVEKVTHIAPADEQNRIIGTPLEQKGVINYDKKALFLCGGFTQAQYVVTTEVYPDSPLVDDENCIVAQVAAVTGGLNYLNSL